jgi:hypothetical protein
MIKNLLEKHQFQREQHVFFIGGEGIIQSCKFENGNWQYAIEMPQGVQPKFGRIGPETIVLLDEIDLRAD